MNRKIRVIFVAAMAVAMLATFSTPVLAAEKVSAIFIPLGPVQTGGTTNITPSGIIHVTDAERTANAKLQIGSVWYVGSIKVSLDYVVDPIKGTTTQHYHKMTITFPIQNDLIAVGVFEGVATWTASYNAPWVGTQSVIPTTLDMHGVLQGSGGFEGYTLHIIIEPIGGTLVQSGWVVIR